MAVSGLLRLSGRFLGNAVSESFAFAAGVAIGPVLGPPTQALRNQVNAAYPEVPIGPGVLADAVAQGKLPHDSSQAMASHSGISGGNFDLMVAAAKEGPGSGYAFDLWRRGVIDEAGFRRALLRMGLEQEWIDDLARIEVDVLSPEDVARGIHRGLMPDPGLLRGNASPGPGNVQAYPVYNIDALKEAMGSGVDHDRLGVLVGLQGLPMGPHEAAQAYFRGIIEENDFLRAIAEGNTRNEWADAILEQARQIPTARDFIENALRGYRTLAEAQAGAALHGMSAEHARLIFQNSGRPLNLHQITQALAWGAKYNPQPGDDPDPYMNSVLIGSVTPAYYEMQDALKYTLPGYFVVKAMLANKTLTVDDAATIFKRQAWPPDLADKAAAALAPTDSSGPVNPYVTKADAHLWATVIREYTKGDQTRAKAETALTHLIPDAAERQAVFDVMDVELAFLG